MKQCYVCWLCWNVYCDVIYVIWLWWCQYFQHGHRVLQGLLRWTCWRLDLNRFRILFCLRVFNPIWQICVVRVSLILRFRRLIEIRERIVNFQVKDFDWSRRRHLGSCSMIFYSWMKVLSEMKTYFFSWPKSYWIKN